MATSPVHKKNAAILYQSLYLANLLLLPGLSFLYLLWLFFQRKQDKGWHRFHLYRAIQLSLSAFILLILLPLVVIIATDNVSSSIMVMLVYFITLHTLFVLIGMLNIARAMAKKTPLF
ncbi:hypothetical protein tinsulaeT_02690 [Thalassotalea insulae]|uniref:DUF4870 domain-containing protein n=1 Tax=Thalassotalea insulae TaxID=2056778 RepID=A0ABQ6GP35_9GAMM|nr:hypothetical protein [Thalassotalea insulae]GLX76929.1 hypothetical protein tinsulaeT_02690 [Thalassotalea insulae]